MANQIDFDNISDDDLIDVASQILSPEELKDIHGDGSLPEYRPLESLQSGLAGAGQAVTMGYAPDIADKLLGPEAGKRYRELLQKNPAMATLGAGVGSVVSPEGMLANAVKGGRLVQAGLGAATGAAYNVPEQENNYDALMERLKNAAIGGVSGFAVGGAQERMREEAPKAAFEALRPYKKNVKDALQKDNIAGIGKTALDEGIIGNIPRGSEKLLERTEEKLSQVGKQKSALIDQIQSASDDFANKMAQDVENIPINPTRIPKQGKVEYGIDVQKVRDDVLSRLKQDPRLPDAKKFNSDLKEFVDNFAEGEKYISIKDADKLKVDLNRYIKNWYSNPLVDPKSQAFNKNLYSTLNSSIDDTAEFLAKKFNLPISKELKSSKRRYGNLSEIEKTLENRVTGDVANRMISPSDYGMGSTGAVIGAMSGGASGAAVGGATLGALNQFLRKYGSQLKAKQYNNLVSAMDKLGIFSPNAQTISIPAIQGSYNLGIRKKALEKENK